MTAVVAMVVGGHSPPSPSSDASAAALIFVGVPGSIPRGDPGVLEGLSPRECLRGDPHPVGSICERGGCFVAEWVERTMNFLHQAQTTTTTTQDNSDRCAESVKRWGVILHTPW